MKGRCLNHLTKEPRQDNESGRGEGIRTPGPMLPKHVRYQTALHPVVPVSLACPAGDFLSIHPFQQFVNPQNEFFCGFFDSFWAFFGKSPQMPVFSAFFRFSCRSLGAFSAHILLQSLLRDHAEAQKGGSSREVGGANKGLGEAPKKLHAKGA